MFVNQENYLKFLERSFQKANVSVFRTNVINWPITGRDDVTIKVKNEESL